MQIGHAVLHLEAYGEDYLQNLPSVSIKNLLTGSPYPELNGPVHIYSSSGYTSKIEFSGTSMMGLTGDKRNTVHATLYKTGEAENPLYQVDGQWSDEFVFKDVRNKTDLETYDTHTSECTPLKVAPLHEQDPWESRRAWSDVVTALRAGDMSATSAAKSIIEKAQRQMRKKEEAEGRKWEPKFFSRVDSDPQFERLGVPQGEKLHAEMTSGIWRFDEEKFRRAKVPFHGDLTPRGGQLDR
jgi:oxysterol-binding protein-related protein 9/10/11